MMTGIWILLIGICLIFFVGKHPFINEKNNSVNDGRRLKGEYEKVKEGRYSSALVNLMERMMDVVRCILICYIY
jgi:hypothetical protein